MKKIILLAAGACCALLAADFWQTKKFTEWDEKEIKKVLQDSPWCRTFTVEVKGGGGGGQNQGQNQGQNPNRGMGGGNMGGMGGGGGRGGRGGGGGGGMGGMGGGNMGGGGGGGQRTGSATVMARWVSALPVKQAFARAQYGDEAASSPDAVRSLQKQETQYVLTLIGLPRNLVRRGDQMKKNVVLRLKGQDPIEPSDAKAEMKENGVIFLTLYFPREGHPLKPEDGELALELKLGSKTVTQKFKLKNMVFNGKLEI